MAHDIAVEVPLSHDSSPPTVKPLSAMTTGPLRLRTLLSSGESASRAPTVLGVFGRREKSLEAGRGGERPSGANLDLTNSPPPPLTPTAEPPHGDNGDEGVCRLLDTTAVSLLGREDSVVA